MDAPNNAPPPTTAVDDERIRAALAPMLVSGETLSWVGRPSSSIYVRMQDLYPTIGGTALCGMVIWMFASSPPPPPGTSLGSHAFIFGIGATLFAATFYVGIGRYFFDARRRARTIYGLTNRRIIMILGSNERSPKRAWGLLEEIAISVITRSNGFGAIEIDGEVAYDNGSYPALFEERRGSLRPALRQLRDPEALAKSIRAAIDARPNKRFIAGR